MSTKRAAAADDATAGAAIEARLPGWKRPFLALESPDFRHLWFGTLPGTLAMQMSMIARGYVAYDISRSAAAVGLVALASGVPMLLFSLFGGVVADRFPKRNVLLITNIVQVIYAGISALLILTGMIQLWHLGVLAALSGLGIAFSMPSRHSYVAQIVPRERLVNAVALNMAGINFTRIAGPALAGGLMTIAWVGPGGVFLLMTFMYAYVFVRLLSIRHRGEPEGSTHVPALRSIAMGLSYVRGNAVVFTLLMLAFVPVLLGMPYQHLMPVFSEAVFNVGPGGLGLLMAANGVGALIGALTIASLAEFQRRGLLQMALGMTFGISLAAFAFSPSFIMAVGVLAVVGAASAGYQSLNNTLLLDNATADYRGRVMSIYMLTHAATPMAVVPVGFLSDAFGAPLTIGVAGLVLLAVVSLVGLLHPTYRHVT
jgi:MFS transporter, DHA1 family, staphyloferrin A biosynthesis exporter